MIAQLQSVSKSYQSGIKVLNEVFLSITQSDSIAITGPSGSGKSTLLNILGTLDSADEGKVLINDTDVFSLNLSSKAVLRNRFIGFVFQQHHLLPQLSLLENALLPVIPLRDKNNDKRVMERALMLMERVGLKDLLNKFPRKSSVGECQRTAVVRALINNPSLLLADEPTGSLDNENALKMALLLRELNIEQKVALVIVTHSDEISSQMNQIYKLHSAKLERVR